MATFFGRRYLRPASAVSRVEMMLGGVILLLVVALVVFGVWHVQQDHSPLFVVSEDKVPPPGAPGPVPTPAASENPFPPIDMPGWLDPQQVDRFAPDELYKKINGHDEAFFAHGVVGLAFARYVDEADADHVIDVYWYNMGTPDQALSMYKSEEGEGEPLSFGVAGYMVEGAVFFCEGASYVQVMPSSFDEADAPATLRIAERIAARITGTSAGSKRQGHDG